MSTYRCMLRPNLNDFSSSAQVKIQVEFNFKLFEEKNQIFCFPCCSTREDFSVDVSISYVGLILTKPGRFFFLAYGNTRYGQNSISNFLTNFHISGFPCCSTRFPCCSTREDHSIDVSITNVGLILKKLRGNLWIKRRKLFNKLWAALIKIWSQICVMVNLWDTYSPKCIWQHPFPLFSLVV